MTIGKNSFVTNPGIYGHCTICGHEIATWALCNQYAFMTAARMGQLGVASSVWPAEHGQLATAKSSQDNSTWTISHSNDLAWAATGRTGWESGWAE